MSCTPSPSQKTYQNCYCALLLFGKLCMPCAIPSIFTDLFISDKAATQGGVLHIKPHPPLPEVTTVVTKSMRTEIFRIYTQTRQVSYENTFDWHLELRCPP